MKRITIVGGKLQGMEACYLGMKAGIEVTLIDKDPKSPAKKLCSKFICGDISKPDDKVIAALEKADMVLPTMENDDVLECLASLQKKYNFIYAFDMEAYQISKSKKLSDKLFHDNDVPSPKYYPQGSAPYIAKPDDQSGSHGVVYLETTEAAQRFYEKHDGEPIIQEFLTGSSYSIEIIGEPGNYRTYEVTQIHMDEVYDCCMVTSPCDISEANKQSFAAEAVKIAEIMKLKGIMDYEVIDCCGEFKMLEIDARLPSQTPTAVYKATGMNMIEELYDLFVTGGFRSTYKGASCFTAFEHYLIENRSCKPEGEHIMTAGKTLQYTEGFCGSQEAITDCEIMSSETVNSENAQVGQSHDSRACQSWRVTFINSEESPGALEQKRKEVLQCLKNIL